MTNLDRIKNMTLSELAEFNVRSTDIVEWDELYDGEVYNYIEDGWITSDGEEWQDYMYDEAIEHEKEWLLESV